MISQQIHGVEYNICQTVADLEIVRRTLAGQLVGIIDVETSSGDKNLTSKSPFRHCKIAGFAVTVANKLHDVPFPAYYLPVGHAPDLFGSANLPLPAVMDCIKTVASSWELWVNQSIKYDMHAIYNQTGWLPDCPVEDLLTLAKLHNSDRFLYNLTVLSDIYREIDIRPLENSIKPYLVGNSDYGRIPVDVLGWYACGDVVAVRETWHKINTLLDAELNTVRIMERGVTRVLFDAEQRGLLTKDTLTMERVIAGLSINILSDQLADVADYPGFNVSSPKMMTELFVNRLGLPVLKWTNEDDDEKESNPSFGKDVLTEYLVHPRAPVEVVKRVIELRKLKKFFSAFLTPYDELARAGGRIHSNYNQLVRTGRMSCKDPNQQQLDKKAKSLIRPADGNSFLSIDQSQIEFRSIVHYIKDPRCLAAYAENPDTDFHTWVAELAGIARKPAKTVNFLMGYGGGEEKLILALIKDPDLVGGIKAEADAMRAAGHSAEECEAYFLTKARALAKGIYDKYHRTLPSLKRTSYEIANACRGQGFVRNLYKRRRHLANDRAHTAFNSVCQGTAADFIKDALCRLSPVVKAAGAHIVAVVHDEVLFEGPTAVVRNQDFLRQCLAIMETPRPVVPFRVPVRCKFGYSEDSWAAIGDGESYPVQFSDWLKTA